VTTVRASISAVRANSHVTNAISATDATFTPSRKAPANRERRSHGATGPPIARSANSGRKMPMVATTAPGQIDPPRSKCARPEGSRKSPAGDPAPASDFVFHRREVRRGAAKRGQAQAQEQPGNLGRPGCPAARACQENTCVCCGRGRVCHRSRDDSQAEDRV
jgi:hypothetical protein